MKPPFDCMWSATDDNEVDEPIEGGGEGEQGESDVPDASTVFSELDEDGDGMVTPEEMAKTIKEYTALDEQSAQ